MAVLLLALPVLRADDKPKEDKKPLTPKEQFDVLTKDFSSQQRKILADAQKLKGEEQQKQFQKYVALGAEFADKIYTIADENPKDPIATDALFWVVQNGGSSPARTKAMTKVKSLVEEMPLKDLARRLNTIFGASPDLLEAVSKRAEKEEKSTAAGDLLAWVVRNGSYLPIGKKAIETLVEKYPDHQAIEMVCQTLGSGRIPNAGDMLKKILEKSSNPRVKAFATLAIGESLATKIDSLGDKLAEADKVAAEAESYFTKVVDEYGKAAPTAKATAEKALKALHFNRVGLTTPEITAEDLDAKEFKISDYRGKVVLLDFWGNW
jgi:hypothetical protein